MKFDTTNNKGIKNAKKLSKMELNIFYHVVTVSFAHQSVLSVVHMYITTTPMIRKDWQIIEASNSKQYQTVARSSRQ